MTLDGRHVIVVGLGGMGLPLAQSLVRGGAVVSVCDQDPDRVKASELSGSALDIADEEKTDHVIQDLVERHGPLWGVCVTAAVLQGRKEVVASTSADFRTLMDVNFYGTVNVNRAAAKLMVSQGSGGRIVNWSSVNAVGGTHGAAAYAASKAAVETLSQCLALELAQHDITVNVIRPGSIDTPMINHLPKDHKERDMARIPLGRWGTGDDIAHATQMLLSPTAEWITGSVITVDGGMLAAVGRPALARDVSGSAS